MLFLSDSFQGSQRGTPKHGVQECSRNIMGIYLGASLNSFIFLRYFLVGQGIGDKGYTETMLVIIQVLHDFNNCDPLQNYHRTQPHVVMVNL